MKTVTDVLAIRDIVGLRLLRPDDFADRNMTEPEVSHIFRLCDALWLHSGNVEHPHAELTSGKCSDGFVDTLRVLRHTNLCTVFAAEVLKRVKPELHKRLISQPIAWVVGSDHAGAALSHSAGILLNAQHDFTAKGPSKSQIWNRFDIDPGEMVLQVEELVTTTGTLVEVRKGIRAHHSYPINFAPVVATLVHRSSELEFEGKPIVHVVHYDINTWEPADCPLCKAGSKRIRPKSNWAELTGVDR